MRDEFLISKELRDALINSIFNNHKADSLALQNHSNALIKSLQELKSADKEDSE